MATLKLFSFSVLAASALAISTPVMADSKTVEVQHEDLDLASAKGQDRLKTRLRQAVRKVCGSPRAFTLNDRADQNRCQTEAMASATPKVEQAIADYIDNRSLAARKDGFVVTN